MDPKLSLNFIPPQFGLKFTVCVPKSKYLNLFCNPEMIMIFTLFWTNMVILTVWGIFYRFLVFRISHVINMDAKFGKIMEKWLRITVHALLPGYLGGTVMRGKWVIQKGYLCAEIPVWPPLSYKRLVAEKNNYTHLKQNFLANTISTITRH